MPSLKFYKGGQVYTIPLHNRFIRTSPYQMGVLINGVQYYARVTPCQYNNSPVAFIKNGVTFYFATTLADGGQYVVGKQTGRFDGTWFFFCFHAFCPNIFATRARELGRACTRRFYFDPGAGCTAEQRTTVTSTQPYAAIKRATFSATTNPVYRISISARTFSLSTGFTLKSGDRMTAWSTSNSATLNYAEYMNGIYMLVDMDKEYTFTANWEWESYSSKKDLTYSGSGSAVYTINPVSTPDSVYPYNFFAGCDLNYNPINLAANPYQPFDIESDGFDAMDTTWDTFNPNLYNAKKYAQFTEIDGYITYEGKRI